MSISLAHGKYLEWSLARKYISACQLLLSKPWHAVHLSEWGTHPGYILREEKTSRTQV